MGRGSRENVAAAANVGSIPTARSKSIPPEKTMKNLLRHLWRGTTIRQARGVIASTFCADPDLRRAYVDNVAMLLHDRYDIKDYETRNRAGDEIVRLIFES